MFDARRNIPELNAPDIRNCQFFGKIRIFTEIFKISAAQRAPLDIDTRSKDHILALMSFLFYSSQMISFDGSVTVTMLSVPLWVNSAPCTFFIVQFTKRSVNA